MSSTVRGAAAWLLPAGLAAYILYATRDWHVPAEGGVAFGPLWAILVVAGLAGWWWRVGRPSAVAVMAVSAAVGMVLTDVTSFWSQGLRDWHLYLKAGMHFLEGGPVYIHALFTMRPDDLTNYPFLYPPLTLPGFALLSLPPRPVVDAAWLALSAGAAVWALRRFGVGWAWVALFLVWPPFEQGLYVGNVAIPLFALFVAAPVFGAGLILSALFKLYSGIASLWLPLERRWRDIAIGVGLVAGWFMLTLPIVGLDRWSEWLTSLGLYRESQPLLPGSLVGLAPARVLPQWLAVAIGVGVLVLALPGPGGRERLWRLGVATIATSPSLYSHGYVVAVPAILRLRAAALWLVMGITSVEPGVQWFYALGLIVASWYVPALRRESEPQAGPGDRGAALLHPLPRHG
ncbi:MAG TPA: glycosyltransferase family 87 protein [Candidatus Limnocylindria bacterium]|nr:glycosyltransferase family 87 protein [Candidatus Limnocylindria bacterium]